jgi:hypothetical protein
MTKRGLTARVLAVGLLGQIGRRMSFVGPNGSALMWYGLLAQPFHELRHRK